MTLLGDYLMQLEALGFLDVLLPFLLIFTIVFAVLQKSKIMGPLAHRFNVIVSLTISLLAVIPHVITPGSPSDVVVIINKALPHVSLLMIACMMALLLIGVFGNDINIGNTNMVGLVVLLSVVAVGYSFLSAAGFAAEIPLLVDPQTRSLLIAILVFGIIVWFITSEPGPKEKEKNMLQSLNDLTKGVMK